MDRILRWLTRSGDSQRAGEKLPSELVIYLLQLKSYRAHLFIGRKFTRNYLAYIPWKSFSCYLDEVRQIFMQGNFCWFLYLLPKILSYSLWEQTAIVLSLVLPETMQCQTTEENHKYLSINNIWPLFPLWPHQDSLFNPKLASSRIFPRICGNCRLHG